MGNVCCRENRVQGFDQLEGLPMEPNEKHLFRQLPTHQFTCPQNHQVQNFCLNKGCKEKPLFCSDPSCSRQHDNCAYMKIQDTIKLLVELEKHQEKMIKTPNERMKLYLEDFLTKQAGKDCKESVQEIYKHMDHFISRTRKEEKSQSLILPAEQNDKLRKNLYDQYQKKLVNLTEPLENIEKDIVSRYIQENKSQYKIVEPPKEEEILQLRISEEDQNRNQIRPGKFLIQEYNIIEEDLSFSPFRAQSRIIDKIYENLESPQENIPKQIKVKEIENIKILSLESTNKVQKLTANDIKEFTKVILPKVENISLKGNAVGDQGLQVLCEAKYDNLKEIDLNDNQIGVKGVSNLVNNTWSKQVEYKLQAAITKDGGYALKAGKSVKTMKTLIKNSKSIDSKAIDELQQKNKKQLFQSMHLMMETPLQGKPQQILKESQEMSKELEEAVILKPFSAERVLLTLKETFESTEITFSKTTNARSQLSIKILSTGMEEQNVMIKHRVVDKQWNFKDFKNNSAKVAEFEEWYKKKIAKEYNADISDITIHKITEGSVNVLMSMSTQNSLLKNKEFSSKEQITLVPFFAAFNLSMDDFDQQYDFNYPKNDKCENQWRGGIPYFQPIHCSRIAIKVLNLYDDGKNDWISMAGVAGQYGVGYHGVNQPDKQVPDKNKTILESIMSGRKAGEMLKGGAGQVHRNDIAKNKKGQKVGVGVYISPRFTTSLLQYTKQCDKLKNQPYRLIFQVRFKPEALKCTDVEDYWVINHSKDVRPYGVILFSPEQYRLLQKLGNRIYTRSIGWDSWSSQYIKFRTTNKLPV